jgi:Fe-S cluster assembly protein SufD
MTSTITESPAGRVVRTLQGFGDFAARVAAEVGAPQWLARLRSDATDQFNTTGLPGSRDEEWRFTSLQALAANHFEPSGRTSPIDAASLSPYLVAGNDGPLLVIVDGTLDATLSRVGQLPEGVTISSLQAAVAGGNSLVEAHLAHDVGITTTPFAAANAALFRDGTFMHIAAGTSLSKPLQVIHVASDAASNTIISPRSLFVIERDASATVVESFVAIGSPAQYLTNAVCEVVMDSSARLEHIRIQREAASAWHVGFTGVMQQRDSHYRSFTLALGGRLSRHNLHARLNASNIETLLYGLYLGRGEQLLDNHTAIFHDQPHCNSWEVYKGILAERSHGVFNGKVFVQPEAQKTDAKQTNRNLLLSDTARVDTKPQLEIFADDVKCTHGATVGKLNEQQRFYLRTRGIAGREAQIMLMTAFVAEVVEEIIQPDVRLALEALVHAEMDALIG